MEPHRGEGRGGAGANGPDAPAPHGPAGGRRTGLL